MALLAWRRHLWAGQDAFAFLWRRTHTEQQVLSPLPIVVCCCLLDRSSRCRSFEEKTLDISRGTWPMMVSSFHTATANGSWSLSLSQRGAYIQGKCVFEISPLPSLGHVYCWKRGGGLIFGRIRYICTWSSSPCPWFLKQSYNTKSML